ncbi:MAG: hypothetical protein ABJD53_16855 [Gammaproteobacteria bacterium]
MLASAATPFLGCSDASAPGHADGSPRALNGMTAGIHAAVRAAAEPACEYVLKIEDVAGLLNAPITATRRVSGDAQSCEFLTAGFPAITVSVRPGLGQSTVEAWTSGKMPLKVSPLTGIGDAAVWQESLHELIAEKNGLLCDIQVRGSADDLALGTQTLPDALGALCNKIFAAG